MSESSFSSCSKEGDVKIWNKADPYNWRLSKKFHHHEKAVYSMVTIDNNQTMVTCSDDRKIHIVNLKTLGLDYSEIVDRSYISSLVRYQKDSFAGGFYDGRVKLWKKEKNGNKVALKLIRTFNCQKVQHLNMLTNNLLFIGGMEKISEVYNLDNGNKVKALKEGHQSAVLCSQSYNKKYLISGGAEGRLVVWNSETGIGGKIIEIGQDEVRQILMIDNLILSGGSNGVIKVWQEIVGQIEQLIGQEEEAARLAKEKQEEEEQNKQIKNE